MKRVATKLSAKHLRQAEMYAVNEGVEWSILTNGADWRAYHLNRWPAGRDHHRLALDVNLVGEDTLGQKAGQLFYSSRESLKRRQIDELWKARHATSPKSLASVLLSPTVTDAIRKELKRSTGQKVEGADVARLLRETVLRRECLD